MILVTQKPFMIPCTFHDARFYERTRPGDTAHSNTGKINTNKHDLNLNQSVMCSFFHAKSLIIIIIKT